MRRIVFLLLLSFFIQSFAVEIVLEAEDFKGKGRLVEGRDCSGRGRYGKWNKLTHKAKIPKDGRYYIWIRYSYNWQMWNIRNLRDFALTLNGKRHIVNDDVGDYGWLVLEEYFPAGELSLTLEKIGNDPYVDVIIITDDSSYLPKIRKHIVKGKWHNDKIINQPFVGIGKKVEIPKTAIPEIDGKLTDQAWSNAAVDDNFRLRHNGESPTLPTRALLCHDKQNLFLAFRCTQDTDKLISTPKIYDGDCIEVAFTTSGKRYPVYHLIVNPKGEIFIEKIINGISDSSWRPENWKVAATIGKGYYQVEIAIPFDSVLEKLPFEPTLWRGNFSRSTIEKKESSTWSGTKRGYTDPNGFGDWIFKDIDNNDFAKIYQPLFQKKLEITGKKNISSDLSFIKMLSEEALIEKQLAEELLPPKGKSFIFEKMNLLPNPNFEYGTVSASNISPLNWYSSSRNGNVLLSREAYRGRFALAIGQTGKNFVLRAGVKPLIDYTVPYRFSGYVQGKELTGENYIKVRWYVPNVDNTGGSSSWGNVKAAGESVSHMFKGSFPYRHFSFECVPPKDAVQCSFDICSSDNKGVLYLDDIKFDGLGSFPVMIIIPQPGFEAKGLKEAVIFSHQTLEKKEFAVHCDGKKMFSGELKYWGKSEFDRHAYTADFSSLKKYGKYILNVVDGDNHFKSHEFEIKDNLYLDYAKLTSNFYYVQRQGVDIPGWHKANFLDDAALWDPVKRKVVGHRDVSGGWQDAGDPSKQAADNLSIYALSSFYEMVRPEWKEYEEQYPDILYLAHWGAKRWIEKLYDGDGLFFGPAVNKPLKSHKIHNVDPAKWTDNIVGTWDDRIVNNKTSIQWHISQLLKYALVIKSFNPSLANEIIKIIELNYANRRNEKNVFYNTRLKQRDFLFRLIRHEGELLRNSMLLQRLTGKEEYGADSREYADSITKTLNNKFYLKQALFDKIDIYSQMRSFPFFISACFEYLEHNDHQELEAELRQYVKNVIVDFSKQNEFGIIANNRPQKRPIADGGIQNYQIASYAYVAAQASRRWKNLEYLKIAERCVQWVVGRNPRNVSMLIGNGWKFSATSSTVAAFSPGHGDGILPGAVIRGIRQQPGTPENYPAINTATNPGGLAISRFHEVYQVDVAMFLLACGEIHMAVDELK